MLKLIILLCFASITASVTANPLLQAVPSQSCPICQQNAYRNIPTNIPFVIQQPTTNFNPYSQINWAQNPVTQTCQQPQVVPTCNNQVTSTNNQLNQELFSKILSHPALRNILNPNTKLYNQNGVEIPRHLPSVPNTASVPNVINNYIIVPPELLLNDTKGYQKDKETKVRNGAQRRRNNSDRNQSETRPSRRKNQDNNSGRKESTERSTNQRRNDSRRDGTQRKVKPTHNDSENECDDAVVEKNRLKANRRKKDRTRTEDNRVSALTNEVAIEIVPHKHEVQQFDKIKTSENDANVKNTRHPEANYQEPANEDNLNLINYQNYERALKQYNSKLSDKPTTQNIEQQNNSDRRSSQPLKIEEHKSESTKIENSKRKNNGQNEIPLKITAVQRNPQEETVIRNLQSKFPGIPEEVVRSLLSHLKRQLRDEQVGASNLYYPGFPMNYDELYQMQFNGASNNNERNNNGRRKNRRNQNKRKRQRNKNSGNTNASEINVELTSSLIDNDSENITSTTTENPTPFEPITETLTETEFPDVVTTELDELIETTTSKSQPRYIENNLDYNTRVVELGMEDIVPTIYVNGIIDDYYPDFTAENEAFVISQEEYGLKNLQEDKYHYTTDKNYEIEELNKNGRKYEQTLDNNYHSNQPIKENKNYKYHRTNSEQNEKNFEIEDTLRRPQDIRSVEDVEEIQFRTPPTLELPDFETRRVDKIVTNYEEEFDDDDDDIYTDTFVDKYIDGGDKVSTYSNFKTSQYNTRDKSSNERRTLRKRSKTDVETVFARSKVAKYGQIPEFSEEVTTPITRDTVKERAAKDDRYQYKTDRDPSIVIAKSIPGKHW